MAHNIRNIALMERELRLEALRAHNERVWQVLEAQKRACKRYAAVDAWLAGFDQVRFRQPFLVLEGPSCLGKSLFAMSLVKQGGSA